MSLFAVVGLGANLGERLATMRAAARELRKVARVEKVSHVYVTAPVGPVPQPDFLNAAVAVTYAKGPEDLLEDLLGIESKLGRVRDERWGPRTIDLDLLWVRGIALRSERLHVPHPQLSARAFALVPLLEVAPDATEPLTGARYVVPPGDVRITPDIL